MKRVVVLGGGFGGAFTALGVAKGLKAGEAEVKLIARENYLFFTPFCTEIVGGAMEVRHATAPLREILGGRASFLEASVERIDLEARRVETSAGPVEYDLLVIALGSATGTFGLPGIGENAYFMRSLPEAIAFRNRVIDCLEEGSRMPKSPERTARLTFAVAGAGPSGVELACDLRDLLNDIVPRQYPDIAPLEVNVKLYEGGDRVLPGMDRKLSWHAERRMKQKGIDVRLETRIRSYNGRDIGLADGSFVRTDTLAWTAGLAPNPVVAALDVPKDRGGRIQVDDFLRVNRHADVFAIGDCAAFVQDEHTLGPEGQVALQEARTCAHNVLAALRGRLLHTFRFRRYGRLVSLGRRYAVTELFGLRFRGFLAWWLWRTAYLTRLPGLRNKVRVMLDWTLDLFFPRETIRIRYSGERPPRESRDTREAS